MLRHGMTLVSTSNKKSVTHLVAKSGLCLSASCLSFPIRLPYLAFHGGGVSNGLRYVPSSIHLTSS